MLAEAARVTSGDRQATYGHPRLHHGATAAAVTAYLRRRGLLAEGAALAAGDWTALMILDKVMRLAGSPKHRDSVVDLAGYARCLEMIQED